MQGAASWYNDRNIPLAKASLVYQFISRVCFTSTALNIKNATLPVIMRIRLAGTVTRSWPVQLPDLDQYSYPIITVTRSWPVHLPDYDQYSYPTMPSTVTCSWPIQLPDHDMYIYPILTITVIRSWPAVTRSWPVQLPDHAQYSYPITTITVTWLLGGRALGP